MVQALLQQFKLYGKLEPPGYWSDVVPTFPISNKVLKRVSADDTPAKAAMGESKS